MPICQNANNFKPTTRDLDILNILWDAQKAMTASEIVNAKTELTMNTVQSVLRKLLKKEIVKVADIVYSGTVLSRSYVPTISSEDFALIHLSNEFQKLNHKVSKASIVATLLNSEQDDAKTQKEIEEIEHLLKEYKKKF